MFVSSGIRLPHLWPCWSGGPELLGGRVSVRRLLIPNADHYLAVLADSGAFRCDGGVVGQRHVHGTTLVRGHGLKGDGCPAVGNPLGYSLGQVSQGVVAPLLIALDVDHQVDSVFQLPADDEFDQELEGPESLASPPYQETGVVPLYLEDRSVEVLIVDLGQADHSVYAQLRDEILQHVGDDPHYVGRLFQDGHSDAGRLTSDSENSSLSAANDVYFDFASLDVEFP